MSCVKTRGGGQLARIIDSKAMNMVGDKVKELRLTRGMSQQAVSNQLETMDIYVCRGSISRIEDKTRTVTDIELYGLSQVFGVKMEELFCIPE